MKCKDCFGGKLYCVSCSLQRHNQLPLHHLLVCKLSQLLQLSVTLTIVFCLSAQHWNGTYFADVTLQKLRLEVHLGHSGHHCPYSEAPINNFTIVDVSGIHTITLQPCACIGALHLHTQLLASSWFPATLDRPQTAFTFDVLDTFQLLTLQGKISTYDFYYSLDHKTDNTGTLGIAVSLLSPCSTITTNIFQDRYHQFLTVIWIFRHIKILKRAGRGHDPTGVDATEPGECAVECPACPHPDRNLPEGWEDAPEHIK